MSLVVYSAHSCTHSRTHSLFQRSVFWKESDALIVSWVQTNRSLQIWHSIKLQIDTCNAAVPCVPPARGTRSGSGHARAGDTFGHGGHVRARARETSPLPDNLPCSTWRGILVTRVLQSHRNKHSPRWGQGCDVVLGFNYAGRLAGHDAGAD